MLSVKLIRFSRVVCYYYHSKMNNVCSLFGKSYLVIICCNMVAASSFSSLFTHS
jgi:hypothetical protein